MNPLITPLWLSERISDSKTVVIDATLPPVGVNPPVNTHTKYLETHIPGAIFFDIEKLSDHSTSLPHMLLNAEAFSQALASLGISETMTIVVYEQEGVFSAPRAWWMLQIFGIKNVYILDGGLRAWQKAGLATERGEISRAPVKCSLSLNPNKVKNFAQIQQLIADKSQILDARSAGRFNGKAPEPRPGLSSGHMPGAISLPFGELLENGRMKSVEKLREVFAAKKVNLEMPVTTTCGSGVTAAVISLALQLVGAKQSSLYDGSWAEYAQQPNAVIEKSL